MLSGKCNTTNISIEIPAMPVIKKQTNALLVCLGRVSSFHGTAGELKVRSSLDIQRIAPQLECVYIGQTEDLAAPYPVEFIRSREKQVILKLTGADSREAVGSLRGDFIYIPRDELGELPSDEYYVSDLINLRVMDDTETELGVVQDVLENPANDILVIQKDQNEQLIPMVGSFIQQIDLKNGIIRVQLIEGL